VLGNTVLRSTTECWQGTGFQPTGLGKPPRPNYPVASPHVPVVGLETMNEQIGFSLRTKRLVASLSGVFGGLATLLAVIGLYGVMAYVVMRRTCEFGIGIALGALRSNVIPMVMREAFILIGAGLAAGLSLALARRQSDPESTL
jgi:hypothetical protein